ncbi:uncharacterized protein [Parasteatoda tepidariorum]|uniref:uncharacterized protein isoform X2 n=1 Tax=Parasteatoda tepidariorum TaxID=114398 RepID=UPI00077FA280|nr:uncharacterized protein LOC107439054 isoform X2 [Parasteatoda tepidariorum]
MSQLSTTPVKIHASNLRIPVKMDTMSDRSTEEVITCYLEDDDTWRRRFPRAELCVAGSAFGGFFIISGIIIITLHYTLESREGFHSLLEHMKIASHFLGFSFLIVAAVLFLGGLFAYAVWKVMEVVEMANRYREHRELCAYEDLRQSFRSQQSMRIDKCLVDIGKQLPQQQK